MLNNGHEVIGDVSIVWRSRGYLPHYNSPDLVQHVTFHLADSLPKEVVRRLEEEVKAFPLDKQSVELRKKIQSWMDAGHGSCVLRVPHIGRMVQESLLFFDGQRYRVIAWVVMPNHVHVLFQTLSGWPLAKIVASWKKFTARAICDYRRTQSTVPGPATLPKDNSPVWHREHWDRFIRNESHLYQAMEYIHYNPVKAGLTACAEDWPWSSARYFCENDNQEIGLPGK